MGPLDPSCSLLFLVEMLPRLWAVPQALGENSGDPGRTQEEGQNSLPLPGRLWGGCPYQVDALA